MHTSRQTVDGYKVIKNQRYFIVYIKPHTGIPVFQKAIAKIGLPECICSSCKKALYFLPPTGLRYYPSDYKPLYVFRDKDMAVKFCLDVFDDLAECLERARNDFQTEARKIK